MIHKNGVFPKTKSKNILFETRRKNVNNQRFKTVTIMLALVLLVSA